MGHCVLAAALPGGVDAYVDIQQQHSPCCAAARIQHGVQLFAQCCHTAAVIIPAHLTRDVAMSQASLGLLQHASTQLTELEPYSMVPWGCCTAGLLCYMRLNRDFRLPARRAAGNTAPALLNSHNTCKHLSHGKIAFNKHRYATDRARAIQHGAMRGFRGTFVSADISGYQPAAQRPKQPLSDTPPCAAYTVTVALLLRMHTHRPETDKTKAI
jgi:hypothetical protein